MTQPSARTVAALLTGLIRDPGRPRLTWYGRAGERIELSGAVLDNWVSKTTNLLVEEFDAGPGTRVRLDLPPHWRTLVWALAAWRVGATVLPTDEPADIVVTDRPEEHAGADQLVAVSLPGLSLRWTGPALPPGAIDAAQAVMTYSDAIGWSPEPVPSTAALGAVRHADLLATATGSVPELAVGARVLLITDQVASHTDFLLTALGVLARDGSVVLTTDGRTPSELDRIVAGERIGVRLSPPA